MAIDRDEFDLDELLGKPLTIKMGGQTYSLGDISTEDAIRLGRLADEGPTASPDKAVEVLGEILGRLGVDKEALAKLDSRKALAAAALVMSRFTSFPDELVEIVPGLRLLGMATVVATVPRPGLIESLPSPATADSPTIIS